MQNVKILVLQKQTIGKMLMQIIVTSKTDKPIYFRDILLREVFGKWGMTVSVPIFLGMTWAGNRWLPTVSGILMMILVILFCIIYFIITKHAWYEDLAGLTVKRNLSVQKIKIGFYALLIVTITGAGTTLIEFLVKDRVPCHMAAFQNNNSTKPYVDFLKKQHTNPVDYVIGLFDKYDVVLLCVIIPLHRSVNHHKYLHAKAGYNKPCHFTIFFLRFIVGPSTTKVPSPLA